MNSLNTADRRRRFLDDPRKTRMFIRLVEVADFGDSITTLGPLQLPRNRMMKEVPKWCVAIEDETGTSLKGLDVDQLGQRLLDYKDKHNL